jgi:hypothetical protein
LLLSSLCNLMYVCMYLKPNHDIVPRLDEIFYYGCIAIIFQI